MKTLNEYMNSSLNDEILLLFEGIDTEQTLEEVYEELFDKMFDSENDYQVNEGLGSFFRKLAGKGDKIDAKASELKSKVEGQIKQLSDAAQKSIDAAKKKAGEKWDEIKDTYTAAVASIDTVVQKSSTQIEDILKNANISVENFMSASAKVMTNMYANGKEALANSFGDAGKAAAFNTLLIAAMLCKKNGIDSSSILDILSMAGIQ